LKSWENKIRAEFGNQKTNLNIKRIILERIDSSEFLHSAVFEKFSKSILKVMRNSESRFSFYLRSILTRTFQFDPLKKYSSDPINLVFLVAKKDLEILPYAIASGLSGSSNKILSLTVVSPGDIKNEVEKTLTRILGSTELPVLIETDENLLNKNGLGVMKFVTSAAKMQTIKLCIPFNSSSDYLIIDADTLLLRIRNWVSNEVQISPIAQEYLLSYNQFAKQVLNTNLVSGLGFVTHHGLLRGKVVTDLVEKFGGIEKIASAINTGIELNWNKDFGSPSEWQLYGEYIFLGKTGFYSTPAGFSNLGISRSLVSLDHEPSFLDCLNHVEKLRGLIPALGSLSMHAYKDS
jgi:hypothetical protein